MNLKIKTGLLFYKWMNAHFAQFCHICIGSCITCVIFKVNDEKYRLRGAPFASAIHTCIRIPFIFHSFGDLLLERLYWVINRKVDSLLNNSKADCLPFG